jgi:hypothetical protein
MNSIFDLLSFFGGTAGLFLIGGVTALMIILWDWRIALAGLFFVQVGVVCATVAVEQLPSEWAWTMVIVMGLACLILTLSAQRMTRTTSLYQAGTWPLRSLLLGLLYVAWNFADVVIPLPVVAPQLAELFVWLTICMLVMLGLSDNPLFSTVALLIWLIPAQVVVALIVNAPALVALIGMLTLLLALAGSYLILVEQVSVEKSALVVTDITFTGDLRVPVSAQFPFEVEEEEEWLERWVEKRILWLQGQSWASTVANQVRQLPDWARRWRR